MPKQKQELKVDGRVIPISNPDKVLFPGARFTKAQVIDYYIRVADFILPHLKDRPVTLKRYPDGVDGEFFYEKNAPAFTPSWVKTFPAPRREGGSDIRYILVNDLATLVWLANLANIEIHPFLHRVPHIDRPSYMVFDLDPGEGADVLSCARVALLLKDVLARLELESFVKVSGSKGIQLYVPLNTPITYAVTRPFARSMAQWMEQQYPDLVVSGMAKVLRKGKVLIDWSQNADSKTTVGVYSLRAKRPQPYVSMPLEWSELKSALKAGKAERLDFPAEDALKRIEKKGDLFAPVLKRKQKLPKDIGALAPEADAKALETYGKKRDFAKTPEPAPAVPQRGAVDRCRFVMQKHAASHLHYDFRLEMHGVLKSWAVPKGPPLTSGERRLAMETEDHPIEYLDFEGIIPKGEYGGGTVMVWDIGMYELIDGNYHKGKLHIFLAGKKLKGEWRLTRTGDPASRKWLLIKTGASVRPISAKRDNQSALTGHTMEEIAAAKDAQWHSSGHGA
jgi:bifunctional non-homologous end joining protein LigD